MHIQHAVTPTQLRLHEERKERMARFGRPALRQAPEVATQRYRLVYEKRPIDYVEHPEIRTIIEQTAKAHGSSFLDIVSRRRGKFLVAARHEAMWRSRYETTHSLLEIGVSFNRDHTSVMYGIGQHEKRIAREAAAGEAQTHISGDTAKAAPLAPLQIQSISVSGNQGS